MNEAELKGKSCIVVDDSEFAQQAIIDMVTNLLGLIVLATGKNGEDAVQLYKKYNPDILFLDLMMPIKDGKEALVEILNFDSEARIFIVSAQRNPPTILECLRLGAKGWVNKLIMKDEPFEIDGFKKDVLNAFNI